MGDKLELRQIGQIAIPVTDIDRAVAFYRDVLGMQFLFQAPPSLGFFDCDGVRVMLDGPAAERAGRGSVLYFKVADIQVAYQALVDQGVDLEGEPHLVARMPDHELWMTFFRDPDQNLLALMCEVREG
jgi:methylmalonyl-CoA/ethylmalonyl-CoA epimerase